VCDPLGAAKRRLAVCKGDARRGGYVPPRITAEELLKLKNESLICVGCEDPLDWDNYPHLHHDHRTGEVLGFCHPMCNQAEGMLGKMTSEGRKAFIKNFFPEVINV
jgi:hypothetical protein